MFYSLAILYPFVENLDLFINISNTGIGYFSVLCYDNLIAQIV
nr:MAG TPA: hypothetical protein [Caudoviricetes sp.]